MARIGVDGTMISPHGKGHARSQLHAVEALAARGENELVVFVRHPSAAKLLEPAHVEVAQVRRRLTIGWELVEMPRAARRLQLDAMLTLSERLPIAGGPPTVVWLFESPVHRIRTNRRSRAGAYQRSSDLLTGALWERSMRRAMHVAFGSRATADEVLVRVGDLRSWSVVHPGVPPGFSPGPALDRGCYVLHLGSSDPRENTQTAIEACRRAGIRLLVAGEARLGGGDRVNFLGRVRDEELVDLYRGAVAYLHPSLYEGFGYGVVEAMACGTPVVAGNVTSIPEIVGDAGLLCDPRSPDELAAALRRVLEDPLLAEELRARGLRRAARFTWERTGEGLAESLGETLDVDRR